MIEKSSFYFLSVVSLLLFCISTVLFSTFQSAVAGVSSVFSLLSLTVSIISVSYVSFFVFKSSVLKNIIYIELFFLLLSCISLFIFILLAIYSTLTTDNKYSVYYSSNSYLNTYPNTINEQPSHQITNVEVTENQAQEQSSLRPAAETSSKKPYRHSHSEISTYNYSNPSIKNNN